MKLARTSFDGTVIRETELAVLVETEDHGNVWIPRSACENGDMLARGDDDIRVVNWWLRREGYL